MTTFAEMNLPPPLAEAIAARGYEQPTVVQAEVGGGAHAGRDLLVSSETGSGKTLAFGIALADAMLGGAPRRADARGAEPLALVITPTRELATQVRNELAWLYGKTKLRIAAFTGGTSVQGDVGHLRHGVDLVVGTPGRLVDLLERKSLKLAGVRAVVLDEADEMLDMGFREDLETLLSARAATVPDAPERARTFMFSATLPQPILAMAARYQHDAVRIDARTQKGASGSHQDIEYVAHLVGMGDRKAAVINVLRQHKGVRAILFGTTRDGVAAMHQELGNRGFRAVVLSGDRAQAERTRALNALRSGAADLLVATNVAARGLDLPEVDLVLHADLPLNAEALTHRSGRTGRAGRKGKSVLIATLAERRKAERLFANARVAFTWTAAPGAKEIARAAEEELAATLLEEARGTDAQGDVAADARELAGRLRAELDVDALLVTLLRRELARLPSGEELAPVDLSARPAPLAPGARTARGDFSRGAVVFRVNLGASQKAEPGWLLPLICRRGGITRHDVGAIRVGPQQSEFEISSEAANDFALAAEVTDPRAPHVRIQRVSSATPEPHAGTAQRVPRGAPRTQAPWTSRPPGPAAGLPPLRTSVARAAALTVEREIPAKTPEPSFEAPVPRKAAAPLKAVTQKIDAPPPTHAPREPDAPSKTATHKAAAPFKTHAPQKTAAPLKTATHKVDATFKTSAPHKSGGGYKGSKPFQTDAPHKIGAAGKSGGYKGSKPYQGDAPYKGSKPFQADAPHKIGAAGKSGGYKGSKPYQDDAPYKGSKPYQGDAPYKGSKPFGKAGGSKPFGKPGSAPYPGGAPRKPGGPGHKKNGPPTAR